VLHQFCREKSVRVFTRNLSALHQSLYMLMATNIMQSIQYYENRSSRSWPPTKSDGLFPSRVGKTHPLTTGNVACTQLIFRLRGEEIVSLPLGLWFIGPHSAPRPQVSFIHYRYTAPTLFFIPSFRLIYSTFYERAIHPRREPPIIFSYLFFSFPLDTLAVLIETDLLCCKHAFRRMLG